MRGREVGATPRRPAGASRTGRHIRLTLLLTIAASLAIAGCTTTKTASNAGNNGVGGQPAPGVTADEAKVGFIGVDLASLAFLKVDPVGNTDQQLQILTEWVNKNGGLGGRKMVPDLVKFQGSTDSPSVEEGLCNRFTQDDKVFAVVLVGQFQDNSRPCYKRGRTIAVDQANFPLDDQEYEALNPFLWAPAYPSYNTYVEPFVNALKEQGFFEGGTRVGVLAPETPVNKRVIDEEAIPHLADVGVTDPLIEYIDVKTTESLNKGLGDAATKFKDAGVLPVVFFGGQRLAPFFATAANSIKYAPRYGLSSFDNPRSIIDNAALAGGDPYKNGAAGISFQAASDVSDAQYPFPGSFGESQCQSIYAQGGLNLKTRSEAANPFLYCDAVLFLKAAMDKAKADGAGAALTPEEFGSAAKSLLGGYTASRTYDTTFDKSHTGASAYRLLSYDPSCKCFQLKGENVSFKPG